MNNRHRNHSNSLSEDILPSVYISTLTDTSTAEAESLMSRRNSEGSPHSSPLPVTPLTSDSLGILSLQDHFPNHHNQQHLPPSVPPHTSTSTTTTTTTTTSSSASDVTMGTPIAVPETMLPPSNNTAQDTETHLPPSKTPSIANYPSNEHTLAPTPSKQSLREETGEAKGRPRSSSVATHCGVDLAPARRNADFHALFRSVPEQDTLIQDYGCALQKEILLQGRMYISESHICFNANIFGWVTNLVVAFTDIVEIEKRSTVMIIPNAIQIATLHAKHTFASFLSRDQAYDLLMEVWRQTRPPPTGMETSGFEDEQEEKDSDGSSESYSDTESDTHSDGTVFNQDLISMDLKSHSDQGQKTVAAIKDTHPTTNVSEEDKRKMEETECDCRKKNLHYPTVVMDQTYDTHMKTLYQLLYDGDFLHTFLTQVQKTLEVDINPWQKGEAESSREISYIKPLSGAIGPKSTKCLLTEDILHKDFTEYVTQLTTTQTPDVPSGGSFSVKTRTCLTWTGDGKVHMFVSMLVDFTKSSWLKSTIEKACIDGQTHYYKDLDVALRHAFSRKSMRGSEPRRRKGRREKKASHRTLPPSASASAGAISATSSSAHGWGSPFSYVSVPSTTQWIVVGMCVMVLVNFYIASKISVVEKRLRSVRQAPTTQEEAVWTWLTLLDQDLKPMPESAIEKRLEHSQRVKQSLDSHMNALGAMIRRAEENIEQVTKIVQEQRAKMKQ
ncbi:hypothetical protein BDF14DRAFT_1772990 [Spinellus fusiger]|nr:hypothetical protein BDF14DRAFT_1772990 [Spinellus fusiger]